MLPHDRQSFFVRARGKRFIAIALVALCATSLATGCRHRRNAMRPMFGRPALFSPAPPCASGDCGGGTVIPGEPAFAEPTTLRPGRAPYESSPAFTSPPANEIDSSRSSGPGTIGDEPILEPTTPGLDRPSNNNRDSGAGSDYESRFRPPLEPPSDQARGGSRQTPQTRQATLRRNVQAYVNDPADLFTPPRADRPWRYIVIHHSASETGSFAQIDRDHRERLGTAGCGYHFVVGNGTQSPDGQVEVATRWSDQRAGQHCRDSKIPDVNDYGIGICLVGNFDDAEPSSRQLAATRALIAYLQDRYQIPAENVVTHDRAARTATTCPGRNFLADAVAPRMSQSRVKTASLDY